MTEDTDFVNKIWPLSNDTIWINYMTNFHKKILFQVHTKNLTPE